MEQTPIIVVGHKNPDTDSICSAIAYANLKNRIAPGTCTPKRAGNLNNETNSNNKQNCKINLELV